MFFKQMTNNICDKWNILMTVCFALFVYGWTEQKDEAIFGILGGVPDYGGGTIEIVSLGKWLFLFGFFSLVTCRTISTGKGVRNFELYRHQQFVKWWSLHFAKAHMINVFTFLVAYLIWLLLCRGNTELEAALIFLLHLSCMTSILLLFDFIGVKIIPCILIIAEGIGYILSVNYNIPWLACGMYNRSIFFRGDGFSSVVFVLETTIILFCYIVVPLLWGKTFWKGRHFKWSIW